MNEFNHFILYIWRTQGSSPPSHYVLDNVVSDAVLVIIDGLDMAPVVLEALNVVNEGVVACLKVERSDLYCL